jgi:hypothetical protein
LLPPRAAVAGLLAPAALVAGSAFSGAASALRLATRAFVVGAAVAFLVFFLEVVILLVFLGGGCRVMTFMPLCAATSKLILKKLLE